MASTAFGSNQRTNDGGDGLAFLLRKSAEKVVLVVSEPHMSLVVARAFCIGQFFATHHDETPIFPIQQNQDQALVRALVDRR